MIITHTCRLRLGHTETHEKGGNSMCIHTFFFSFSPSNHTSCIKRRTICASINGWLTKKLNKNIGSHKIPRHRTDIMEYAFFFPPSFSSESVPERSHPKRSKRNRRAIKKIPSETHKHTYEHKTHRLTDRWSTKHRHFTGYLPGGIQRMCATWRPIPFYGALLLTRAGSKRRPSEGNRAPFGTRPGRVGKVWHGGECCMSSVKGWKEEKEVAQYQKGHFGSKHTEKSPFLTTRRRC